MRKTELNMRTWREAREAHDARIDAGRGFAKHKLVEVRDVVALLEAVIRPGDRAHHAFVERRLSPGGAADVLAMSMLAADLEPTEGW
jgi:triphosphoribosyl-dephospho-CoA synthetase